MPLRSRIRIIVVDEKGLMRDGLCALLGGAGGFDVIGTESALPEALPGGAVPRPHVIVADFPRTGTDGPAALARLKVRLPEVRVLVLSYQRDDETINATLEAGADAYVLKDDSCNELFTAIRSITAGKRYVSSSISSGVPEATLRSRVPAPGCTQPAIELTERELQVLRLIAAGQRTREIAASLSLSTKTIEKHRTSLMRKLGLRNASAAAAYAIAHGLV